MENYGNAIVELRKRSGMTQAELGSELNVTYQAVSKWENNISQPSIDMVADMCKIFNITFDEFIKLARNEETLDVKAVESVPVATAEGLSREETAEVFRQELYKMEKEKVEKEQASKRAEEERIAASNAVYRKKEAGWYRFGFIISLIVAIGALVYFITTNQFSTPEQIALSIGVSYMLFAFGAQLGHDNIITDCFLSGWERSIEMPGVIFSFDMDGILFFIAYKLIIAPLISFVLGLLIGLGGTLIAMLLSMFTLPFKLGSIFADMKG